VVYAYDTETGEKGLKTVQKTFVHNVTELIYVTVNDELIHTNPKHPFYVEGAGFKRADELKVGDRVRLLNGEIKKVDKLEAESLKHPVKVFNFRVADWHDYYVGTHGVLVHNADNPCAVTNKTSSRREIAEQKLAKAELGENNKTIDSRTGFEVGRFIGDDRGNVFIEPKGGSTVPAGKNGVDTHTLYPNGSNYNRYNPVGHGNNSIPHGHGHLMGTGYGRKGQGSSIDALGNVVPFNSSDAHWTIY